MIPEAKIAVTKKAIKSGFFISKEPQLTCRPSKLRLLLANATYTGCSTLEQETQDQERHP